MSHDGTERRRTDGRSGFTKDELKDAMKKAMAEWLDRKFMQFGKWSLASIGAALVVALLYFILMTNGWSHLPQTLQHSSH